MRKSLLIAITIIIISLTGCGQKGPLYLPDNQKQSITNK
ncbi:LPS translocon maturation chaperone LptM [Legionella jordanis]|nr:lipoprotein [Legionella jordanis]RMX00881.1 lipopeptide [Legionella jordanis]